MSFSANMKQPCVSTGAFLASRILRMFSYCCFQRGGTHGVGGGALEERPLPLLLPLPPDPVPVPCPGPVPVPVPCPCSTPKVKWWWNGTCNRSGSSFTFNSGYPKSEKENSMGIYTVGFYMQRESLRAIVLLFLVPSLNLWGNVPAISTFSSLYTNTAPVNRCLSIEHVCVKTEDFTFMGFDGKRVKWWYWQNVVSTDFWKFEDQKQKYKES